MLSPLMMTTHLSVVVHLLLTEVHDGDRTVGEQLSRQGQHARTDHQGIRCLTNLRIGDDRRQGERLPINRDINDEGIATHTSLDGSWIHGRFRANAIVLDLMGYLTATARPVFERLHFSLAIAKGKGVWQLTDLREFIDAGHGGSSKLTARILDLIYQRYFPLLGIGHTYATEEQR